MVRVHDRPLTAKSPARLNRRKSGRFAAMMTFGGVLPQGTSSAALAHVERGTRLASDSLVEDGGAPEVVLGRQQGRDRRAASTARAQRGQEPETERARAL